MLLADKCIGAGLPGRAVGQSPGRREPCSCSGPSSSWAFCKQRPCGYNHDDIDNVSNNGWHVLLAVCKVWDRGFPSMISLILVTARSQAF